MVDPQVSTVDDFAEPETKVITLPRPGSKGQQLFVKIRALPLVRIFQQLEGVPGLDGNTGTPGEAKKLTFGEARELLLTAQKPNEAIANDGVVAPLFYFGDTPVVGRASWDNVHPENQQAIVRGITDLSGFTDTPTPVPAPPSLPVVGDAAAASSFREVAQ